MTKSKGTRLIDGVFTQANQMIKALDTGVALNEKEICKTYEKRAKLQTAEDDLRDANNRAAKLSHKLQDFIS